MDYDEPKQLTESMKAGLARMYADEGFRAYLDNAINIANRNILTCLRASKTDEAKDFTVRLDTLEKLKEKGKSVYNSLEKLRRSNEPLLEKEKQDEKEH